MSTLLKSLMVSTEFVSHQKGYPLKNAMVEILEDSRSIDRGTPDLLNKTDLSKLIMKYTGLKITFNTDRSTYANACIMLTPVDINNVLMHIKGKTALAKKYAKSYTEEVAEQLKSLQKELTGSIDIKNSKVSGIFSKINCNVYLTVGIWNKKYGFTSEEVAAIILHELGHGFCNFMYLLESVRTNMVLTTLNRSNYFESDTVRRVELLYEIEDSFDVSLRDKESIAVCDEMVTYSLVLDGVINTPRSELKSNIMDERTFEFLSDQFATAHGSGLDLASGLNKMNIKYGTVTNTTNAEIFSIMKECLTVVGSVLSVAFLPQSSKIFAVLFYIILGSVEKLETYDRPMVRIRKVKEQLQHKLKNKNLLDFEKKAILDEIDGIEYILKSSKENIEISRYFTTTFLPWQRKRDKVAKLQHDYETIANNPLFGQSAKIAL